jgi:hypothetical protein
MYPRSAKGIKCEYSHFPKIESDDSGLLQLFVMEDLQANEARFTRLTPEGTGTR